MNCFSYLRIPKNADAWTIKKAYARQLKELNQPTDPEEFARLRTAYETALRRVGMESERAHHEGPFSPTVLNTQEEYASSRASPSREQRQTPVSRESDQVSVQTNENSANIAVSVSPQTEVMKSSMLIAETVLLELMEPARLNLTDVRSTTCTLQSYFDSDRLDSVALREAFESVLIRAITQRRFEGFSGCLLLAASNVFGWLHRDALRLKTFGHLGEQLSDALNEIAVMPEDELRLWVLLAAEPTPPAALRMEPHLFPTDGFYALAAAVFFAPGHLQRWREAHDSAWHHAPLHMKLWRFVRFPSERKDRLARRLRSLAATATLRLPIMLITAFFLLWLRAHLHG